MTRLTLTIDSDNDALAGDEWQVRQEVSRLLFGASEAVRDRRNSEGLLRDANGNSVGSWEITLTPPEPDVTPADHPADRHPDALVTHLYRDHGHAGLDSHDLDYLDAEHAAAHAAE